MDFDSFYEFKKKFTNITRKTCRPFTVGPFRKVIIERYAVVIYICVFDVFIALESET